MTQDNTENQPKRVDSRSVTWAAILYPDSLPADWESILDGFMVPALVSPLHDRDINADGEPKKPHRHLLLHFSTKKSITQVRSLLEPLNGSQPQRINDFRSYARYLCHLDNPSKAQYSRDDVLAFSGLDYASIVGTSADRMQGIGEMMAFCRDNCIYSFAMLCDYARDNRSDWFRLLCDNSAHIMGEFVKSLQWEAKNGGGCGDWGAESASRAPVTTSAYVFASPAQELGSVV